MYRTAVSLIFFFLLLVSFLVRTMYRASLWPTIAVIILRVDCSDVVQCACKDPARAGKPRVARESVHIK